MKISNVTKHFDNFDLNWAREDNLESKIYGLVGANGCGKTTLLKIAAGLITPDSGQVDYGGLSPRDVTMVFRRPYLMRDTVLRNLIYPLKLRKIKPKNEKTDFYLRLAGLENLRNQYAPSLSGGEQQKLALIRALIFEPKVILLDEAFSNMDAESVFRFENHILKIQQTNPVTWVITSHQLPNIKRLCDVVYFMNKGRLIEEGVVDEVFKS